MRTFNNKDSVMEPNHSFCVEPEAEVTIVLNDSSDSSDRFDLVLYSFLADREEDTIASNLRVGGCGPCTTTVSQSTTQGQSVSTDPTCTTN